MEDEYTAPYCQDYIYTNLPAHIFDETLIFLVYGNSTFSETVSHIC